MLIKRLLQFNLFVSAVIAVAFILVPDFTLSLYGISGSEALLLIARYFGTTHLSFTVLIGIVLRTDDLKLFRFLAIAFFAGDLVGTIILLLGQLQGLMNAAGWGFVGLSALFAIGYGFASLSKPTEM